jgi:16S rRNA (adenine1518-N6/adenine1519-N6)-dimethyltransferase
VSGYPSPRALLEKYGLRPKKSWGQNFLADEAAVDEIARLAVPEKGAKVIELGAGLGHLTARLLAHGAEVVAVERDRDMARVLEGELGAQVTLVEADAAQVDYARLAAPRTKVAVCGNLPYHLTSPILFSLLDQRAAVSQAVFLLQQEVAERLGAEPGTKDWGLLSVLLQLVADVSVEHWVPRGAFLPPPKVDSAVILIRFRATRGEVTDEGRFRRLVKAGFAQRRKTLKNALSAADLAPPDALGRAFAAAGIDGGRRGETLTVEEWAALERALAAET